jgi:hypothetical protein
VLARGGEVVEQGSHWELLAKKGVYSRMWLHQQSEDHHHHQPQPQQEVSSTTQTTK